MFDSIWAELIMLVCFFVAGFVSGDSYGWHAGVKCGRAYCAAEQSYRQKAKT